MKESKITVEIEYNNDQERLELLSDAIELLTISFDCLNSKIHAEKREQAFLNYLRTGK